MPPWNRPTARGASLAQFIDRFVLGEKMVLPLDAVMRRLAAFGPRGGAKTNPATVLVEELVGDQLPIVILDPMGTWYGLSLATDGHAPGLPITVVGGLRGSLEVREDSGNTMADFAVGLQRPLVVDLSSLSPRGTRRFVADFVDQVVRRRPRPIHLVVAEADTVAPEHDGDDCALSGLLLAPKAESVGFTLISERPAAVSSRILAHADAVVCGRVASAEDRAAIRAWLRTRAPAVDVRRVFDTLATLDPDEAWVCSPHWLGVERVTLRHRATYDAARSGSDKLRPPPSRPSAAELARLRARCPSPSTPSAAQTRDEPAPRRRRGRPVEDLVLTSTERSTLLRYTKHTQSAPQLAMRARIVLDCAEGQLNGSVARDLGISIQMVGRWRRRFLHEGLRGLEGSPSALQEDLEP
jgi:hypothetical protein